MARSLALLGGVQRCVEKGVNEGRLAQAGFTYGTEHQLAGRRERLTQDELAGLDILRRTDNHNIEVEAFSHTLAMPLVGKVGKSNVAGELSAHDIPGIGSCLCRNLGVLRYNRLRRG